jgi:NAD(P)-dependent dehydrogenase (short-subunit alcohol dehydrogenase family)
MKLSGKTIILTGAAGGIGEALARRFSRENPRALLLLDLHESKLQTLAGRLSIDNLETGTGDVSDPADIKAWVDHMEARYGGVDLFCSNAGIFAAGGADADLSAWQKSLDVNVMAHVHAARACLPGMLARGSGYFLQTISAAGLLSQIGSAPYTVSKHASLGFAEWLAITHGRDGIGVTALCPQGVRTDMLSTIDNVDTVAGDGLAGTDEVAECAADAIARETFLALPHPRVADYFRRKAEDHDRWIRGMQRLQEKLAGQ